VVPRGSCLLPLVLALGLTASAARAQDFDPHGRHHHPPPATRPGPRPGPATAPRPAGAPAPEGASSGLLLERYTKIVLARPGDLFPLQRLAQLYRDRDGSLKKLTEDLEKRAQQPADAYAATVALAGVQKIDGRVEDAIATYEKAIPMRAGDPAALLALAHVQQDRGNAAAAKARYQEALPLQRTPADKEQTIRALMTLCLDSREWDEAKTWHKQLVALQPASLFVRGELARELLTRSEYERAEGELRDLVTAAQGDNRTLAPALKDLGKTLAKEHKNEEALTTLRRALSVAGAEAGVRGEVYEAITEIYRADQRLPEWVTQLESEHPSDFARLALLGSLYEETGDAAKALATYKRALGVNPRQIDLRLKMIRLLQSQGELDQAIAEYDGLIRAAPNNPQFVFEECDALMQRGDRARALKLLTQLEARATGDEDVLARVADYYQRIGEGDRSTKVLARLAQSNASDPSHLVDLGDRYYQDGNVPLALQTWRRILVTVQPRAKALSTIADVYLEHDMRAEALQALREAFQLDPQSLTIKKQLAGTLERTQSWAEALGLWYELGAKAKQSGDKTLARESRSHMVTLWSLQRVLEQQVPLLASQFNAQPPDVDAGRTLAEVQLHLRRLPDAEATLRRIIDPSMAPGDSDSYIALERVLVQEQKLAEAIKVLAKLIEVDPKRARELYQRMAQYAFDLHMDDAAIQYAEQASTLSPEDAEGHRRLGALYHLKQDNEHAIREYRAAIQKNDRLFVVYFELADLLLARGESDEADALFRRVIRGAPDEELIARAASLSMQINLGKGTLESLEQELLPLAIGNPQRPVYRRQLVQMYDRLTFGLVQRVRHAGTSPQDKKDADDARAALARVGARAVKPLLDAMADTDAEQQRIAIDVLGKVANKNAGPALFAFATGTADSKLRVEAMTACGSLRDPALLPKYQALLGHDDDLPTDGVAVAAVWGVARMEDKRAIPLLRKLAGRGTPEMRAFAILGLGAIKDRASARAVAAIAQQQGMGNVARAASAYVLGGIGDERDRATLILLAEGTDPLSRQMAVVGLARMPTAPVAEDEDATIAAIADALFAGGDPESRRQQDDAAKVRRAGRGALVARATKGKEWEIDPLAAVDDTVDVEAILARVVPTDLTAEERAKALVKFARPIEKAARTAITTGAPGSAAVVIEAMIEGDGAFEPFVGPAASDATVPATAYTAARTIARELEPQLLALAPTPQLVTLLARSSTAAAQQKVVSALSSKDETVQRSALAAIGAHADAAAVAELRRLLATNDNWATRKLAVQAMGRLGAAGSRAEAAAALRESAQHDAYALVREAALLALASFDLDAARPLAKDRATNDPEPRVREAAKGIAAAP
jgi:tetratricopeptide (TPR) repeat protein/HEAT repeat protein